MPATFETIEKFPKNTPKARLDEEIRLRIKAGAIKASIETTDTEIILRTVWNVIGENDE